MTTNKPEVVGYLVEITSDPDIGAFFVDHEPSLKGCVNTPLVLLSDYEALQAENEKLRKDAERYKEALARISIQVDGNIRECVRDCVNGQPDVQDIYGYCDEIDSIIDAAMETTK